MSKASQTVRSLTGVKRKFLFRFASIKELKSPAFTTNESVVIMDCSKRSFADFQPALYHLPPCCLQLELPAYLPLDNDVLQIMPFQNLEIHLLLCLNPQS